MSHILDSVRIIPAENPVLRDYLRQLPENVFPFVKEFTAENKPQDYDLFVRSDYLGLDGIALIVKNPHLFGDPFVPRDNPLFNIPSGASNVIFIPSRLPPNPKGLVAGVEFHFKDTEYFFGHEYSPEEAS